MSFSHGFYVILQQQLNFLKHGAAGPDVFEKPFVVGHECAGLVEDVGAKVEQWKKGDRVAIKPGAPCLKYGFRLSISVTASLQALEPSQTFKNIQHTSDIDLEKADFKVSICRCDLCTTGFSNLCSKSAIDYFGTPTSDGSACTVKLVPEEQLVRLTPKISWVEAGLIQPLAISIQMARQAELKAHQKVMIFGGGCIGLLLGAIAKA